MSTTTNFLKKKRRDKQNTKEDVKKSCLKRKQRAHYKKGLPDKVQTLASDYKQYFAYFYRYLRSNEPIRLVKSLDIFRARQTSEALHRILF